MYRVFAAFLCVMMFAFTALAAAEQPVPEGLLKRVEEQSVAVAASAAVNEYAKDMYDAAVKNLAAAKENSEAGKTSLATRQLELAEVQLNAAEAKGLERELVEKVAVRRAELKKVETRLERYRQGEEN